MAPKKHETVVKNKGKTHYFYLYYLYYSDISPADRRLSISSASFAPRRCVCARVRNDRLHFTDTVFLCTHMSSLIEDSAGWIAGKSGD